MEPSYIVYRRYAVSTVKDGPARARIEVYLAPHEGSSHHTCLCEAVSQAHRYTEKDALIMAEYYGTDVSGWGHKLRGWRIRQVYDTPRL